MNRVVCTLIAGVLGLPVLGGPSGWAALPAPLAAPAPAILRPSRAQIPQAQARMAKATLPPGLTVDERMKMAMAKDSFDRALDALVIELPESTVVLLSLYEGKWACWLGFRLGPSGRILQWMDLRAAPEEGRLWVQGRTLFLASDAREDEGAFWTLDLATFTQAGPGPGLKAPCASVDPPFVLSDDGHRLAVVSCGGKGAAQVSLYRLAQGKESWQRISRWDLPPQATRVAFTATGGLMAVDAGGVGRWVRALP